MSVWSSKRESDGGLEQKKRKQSCLVVVNVQVRFQFDWKTWKPGCFSQEQFLKDLLSREIAVTD